MALDNAAGAEGRSADMGRCATRIGLGLLVLEALGALRPSLRARIVYALLRYLYRPLASTSIRTKRQLSSTVQYFIPTRGEIRRSSLEQPRCYWVVPKGKPCEERVILYLHGGAYSAGSMQMYTDLVPRICEASGCRALFVEYSLAPEHPFPAGLSDAIYAYGWLLDQGYKPENISLVGDSAGGGLSLALLVACKEADLPLPSKAVLMSPWTDLLGTGSTYITMRQRDPVLSGDDLLKRGQIYADGLPVWNPLISPLYADLSGLPPTLVLAGTEGILFDDSRRLVTQLRAEGVKTRFIVGKGMWHVWPAYALLVPEARKAVEQMGAYIKDSTTLDET